jgi:hypothetical protein
MKAEGAELTAEGHSGVEELTTVCCMEDEVTSDDVLEGPIKGVADHVRCCSFFWQCPCPDKVVLGRVHSRDEDDDTLVRDALASASMCVVDLMLTRRSPCRRAPIRCAKSATSASLSFFPSKHSSQKKKEKERGWHMIQLQLFN